MMTLAKWVLAAAAIYAAFVAVMYVAQRKLLYFPDTRRVAPASVGLTEVEEIVLNTADGEKLIAWHALPRDDKPVVIYFQGNGGGLNLRARRFRRIIDEGLGLIALCYRGYCGSTGTPTEPGLLLDAGAAFAFAAERYPTERIVLWGESLGTAVAVALAAEVPVARVLLESPFTSAVDLAAGVYPFIPVRWLMKDQFRSDQRVNRITAPVMILHGEVDSIVPLHHGERLYALVRAPKRLVRLANADHNDHDEHGGLDIVVPFLLNGLTAEGGR